MNIANNLDNNKVAGGGIKAVRKNQIIPEGVQCPPGFQGRLYRLDILVDSAHRTSVSLSNRGVAPPKPDESVIRFAPPRFTRCLAQVGKTPGN